MKKTPISYYGGKQNMVSEILPLIPQHIQYVEAFTGGGALFFAKPKSRHEVMNDLDGRITNFYSTMQTDFDALHEMILSTSHSEIHHKRAKEILINGTGSNVERAWALWVQTNMSFTNKIYGGFAFCNGGKCTRTTSNKRDHFYRYKDRLKHVEIFTRDALELIKLKDSEDTFFYLDPPYVSSDCGHYKGYTMDNFIELLDTISNIKGKFLLSSYPELPLMEYRERFNWNIKDTSQSVSVTGKRKERKEKTECLTFNYVLTPTLF